MSSTVAQPFFLRFSWISSSIFCHWPSRPQLVVQVQISATFPWFSPLKVPQYLHPQYLCHINPIISVNFGGSFILGHEKLSNNLLFDVLQHSWEWVIHFEPNPVQTIMFAKPHHMANWISKINEQVGTRTAWLRFFHRGITFWTP